MLCLIGKNRKKPRRRLTMVGRIKHMADKELLDEAGRNVNARTALILKHHGIEVKSLMRLKKESTRRMKAPLYKQAEEKVLSGEETDRTEEIVDMLLFEEGEGKRGYGRGDELFGGEYGQVEFPPAMGHSQMDHNSV